MTAPAISPLLGPFLIQMPLGLVWRQDRSPLKQKRSQRLGESSLDRLDMSGSSRLSYNSVYCHLFPVVSWPASVNRRALYHSSICRCEFRALAARAKYCSGHPCRQACQRGEQLGKATTASSSITKNL